MKAEVLSREFVDRVLQSDDGRLRLRPADAIELVDRAAEEGVPIVRVTGVRATDSGAELPVVREADFSSAVREGHGCWQGADAFELTLGDDPLEIV